MRPKRQFNPIVLLIFILTLLQGSSQAFAGEVILNSNKGESSSTWFIDGESTLVMNGFDLTSLGVALPAQIDAVSIAVNQAVPDAPIQIVIYEDANGGSPVDARLVYQTQTTIQSTGTVRIVLPQPATVNAPAVWVGFYLPVGFRFFADESGSSVLTYWGWSPGATFDLANLSTAAVFGPSDGSAPVSITMGGIARITAEVINTSAAGFTGTGETEAGVTVGRPIDGGEANLSLMSLYPYCGERLLYDQQDVQFTANLQFSIHCRPNMDAFQPGQITNRDVLPSDIPSYERRGQMYEVFVNGETASGSSERLLNPVTHCLRPEQGELATSVIAIAYGAPRAWEFLPTVRFGEWVCAEVSHQGFLSYFVPRTGTEPTINADLYFISYPALEIQLDVDSPGGLLCGYNYRAVVAIRNQGFVPTPQTTVRILMTSNRTGAVSRSVDYTIPPIQAGQTVDFRFADYPAPSTFINEAHTLTFIIDPGDLAKELLETNNTYTIQNVMVLRTNKCR